MCKYIQCVINHRENQFSTMRRGAHILPVWCLRGCYDAKLIEIIQWEVTIQEYMKQAIGEMWFDYC